MASEGILVNGVTEILTKLLPVISQQITQAWGVKDDLKKLGKTLESIQALISDAEEKQIKEAFVRLWLRRLKDVIYDADDVMDEFCNETMRRRERGSQLKHKVRDFISKSSNPLVFNKKMAGKIRVIKKSLDEIYNDRVRYSLNAVGSTSQVDLTREQRYRITTSVANYSNLLGREGASSEVVKMLTNRTLPSLSPSTSSHNNSSPQEQPSAVSIVGLGGLGKTSLAQLVYKDESINNYFEQKIWVCTSDNFDVSRILKQILESLTGGSCGDLSNVDVLATKVRNELIGMKYLLVLDNLWCEDAGHWEKLQGILVNGVQGNKILVTTRSQKVASVVGGKVYNLQKLEDDVCWSIMQKRISLQMTQNMINIGRDIAKKCDGLPLAANFLGSLLHSKREEREWVSINEDNNMWVQPKNRRVISILKLSYDNLPSPLKQCFSYCCLFPKDFEIERKKLIQLWIAEGFIQSSEVNSRSMEDIGNDYFEYLLFNSFFQDIEQDEFGDIVNCKMHDLVHDLAISVVDLNRYGIDGKEDVSKVRRLQLIRDSGASTSTAKVLRKGKKMSGCTKSFRLHELTHGLAQAAARDCANNLRTVVGIQGLRSKLIKKIFRDSKHLRVLELRNCRVGKLLDWGNLSKMRKLRYLDLSDCRDIFFGQSISSLWQLQTLVLRGCDSLAELPRDIGSLRNLRYLDVSETNIRQLPNSIKNLCKLKLFKVDHCRFLEMLPSEFGNLTHLKCLDLSGTRIKELHESIIRCLCNLETIQLGHCKLPQEVGHLKCLKHFIYEGDKFETPRGIRQLTCLQTLQQFVVRKDIESNGGGIGDLEDLNLLKGKIKICKLENVQDRQDAERANLKVKHHLRCLDLHWSLRNSNDGGTSNDGLVLEALQPHPNLEILKIKNFMGSKPPQWMCESPSSYLPKLEELVLIQCSLWQQLPALGQLPNLKVLSIQSMDSVKLLGNELYEGECSTSERQPTVAFPSLIELTLEIMANLEVWDVLQSTLAPFPLLEKLTISSCSKLKSIRTPFPTLKELKLQSCQLLEDLPDVQCLEALQKFITNDCKQLKLLPDDLKHIYSTAARVEIDIPIAPF